MASAARDLDLVIVGEINADIVVTDPDPVPVFGQAERIVSSVALVAGSSAVITAMGAARLGLRVVMGGVVGDDPLGRFMLEALASRGIETSACRVSPDRPTGASVILGNGTDRAILTALGTIRDVRAADVPASLLARTRHLHAASFFLQPGLAAELPALFRAARSAGATTSLDPNFDPSEQWDGGFRAAAAEADVLLPNATEACRLGQAPDPEAGARSLATLGDRRRVVAVKLGPDGALGVEADGAVARVPAPAFDAVLDTTGAGDAFDAGFLAAWLDGATLEDALGLAVACGTLSTRAPGGTAGQPTRAEAEALLRP